LAIVVLIPSVTEKLLATAKSGVIVDALVRALTVPLCAALKLCARPRTATVLVVEGSVNVPDATPFATIVVVPETDPLKTVPPVPAFTVVEVIDVKPEILVAVLPSAIEVEPIVTLLLASCAFGIQLVLNTPVLLL